MSSNRDSRGDRRDDMDRDRDRERDRDRDRRPPREYDERRREYDGPRMRPIEKVDRELMCPFLLRIFPCFGKHHSEEEYISIDKVPSDELHLYTWVDATFGELTNLLKNVNTDIRKNGVKLSFSIVSPNHQGRFIMREVANVNVNRPNDGDGAIALCQIRLEPGDFLDVAVYERRAVRF